MKQLAIKGHITRGREVIELLEMLEGKNTKDYNGLECNLYYFIRDNEISCDYKHNLPNNIIYFTIKEFLEKYPYKVGDKVLMNDIPKTIKGMNWDSNSNEIVYKVETNVRGFSEEYHVFAYDIQPYKEETVKEKADTSMAPILQSEDYSDRKFGYKIPKGYEFDCIKENEIIIKPIKPQYPKTYEECCKILNIECDFYIDLGVEDIFIRLIKLKRCRDAYWKIAGDWKPDWEKSEQPKFGLYTLKNEIRIINLSVPKNIILVFPTEEMRDIFYKNFKELIELCKELL